MFSVSILGSTGSIGTQTLDVVRAHRNFLEASGLAVGTNINLLGSQISEFSPRTVSVFDPIKAGLLRMRLRNKKIEVFSGEEGSVRVAADPQTKQVVVATPGLPGLRPTLAAIRQKKTIALATKEVLVAAGSIILKEARSFGSQILPIDSEHSAIFQCLEGRSMDEVNRIFLTCSGGPFRGMKPKQLKKVTSRQALTHPNWKMGRKITIDSATLMNKGFEVIEAHWLFGLPFEKIKVIVHPQSVIHSAVEFIDGTMIAQIGPRDMRLPIQFALFYPAKRKLNRFKRFTFTDFPNMSFEHPDKKTFRCLELAYWAGKKGGTYPAVLNAANDIAVDAFLTGRLPFYQIQDVVEKTLENHKSFKPTNLEEILAVDDWARQYAREVIQKLS